MQALDVCDQFQLVEEMIFLLGQLTVCSVYLLTACHTGRMGNIQEALKLITERLQDVNKVNSKGNNLLVDTFQALLVTLIHQ